MLQRRGEFDLLEEALAAEDGGEFGAEHLDRDLAPVLQVLGEVDGRHATRTKLTLDAVAIGECLGEAVGLVHFDVSSSP